MIFRMTKRVALAGALIAATILPSTALTIVRNFGAGVAPANAVGGGNLINVVNAAADYWQRAYLDTHTLTLNFNWAPTTILGSHSLTGQGGVPSRETAGSIIFDNDGSSVWFMDPTPNDNSEWTSFNTTSANLGGGLMNVGRVYTGATGLAAGRTDLYTVVLHEIGHAIGLSSANTAFQAERGDNDIDITGPRPFAGAVIPIEAGTAHLDNGVIRNVLMGETIPTNTRRLASEADIVSNAQISQFTNINLNPVVVVPESNTVALLALPLITLGFIAVRRRR